MQSTQIVIFENECCSLELELENQCLIMNWKGLLPSKAFREVHLQALQQMRKSSISRILFDARRMKTIGSEDAAWVENFWLPAASVTGFRYCAIVESDYVFNQHSLNNIIEKADPEMVTFRYFKDREAAHFWLKHS